MDKVRAAAIGPLDSRRRLETQRVDCKSHHEETIVAVLASAGPKQSCMRADRVPHSAEAPHWRNAGDPARGHFMRAGRDILGSATGGACAVPRETVFGRVLFCLQCFVWSRRLNVAMDDGCSPPPRLPSTVYHRPSAPARAGSALDPHTRGQVSPVWGRARIRSPRRAVNRCMSLAGETHFAKHQVQSAPASALPAFAPCRSLPTCGRRVEILTAARPHISMSPAVTLCISSGSFVCRKSLRGNFSPSGLALAGRIRPPPQPC
jgi:hypothetical protein